MLRTTPPSQDHHHRFISGTIIVFRFQHRHFTPVAARFLIAAEIMTITMVKENMIHYDDCADGDGSYDCEEDDDLGDVVMIVR